MRSAIAKRRAVPTGKLHDINTDENRSNPALIPRADSRAYTSNVVNDIASPDRRPPG